MKTRDVNVPESLKPAMWTQEGPRSWEVGKDSAISDADEINRRPQANTVVVAFKKPKNGQITDLQQTVNRAHNRLCAVGEHGNSLLKVTFRTAGYAEASPTLSVRVKRSRPPRRRTRFGAHGAFTVPELPRAFIKEPGLLRVR